MKSRVKVTASSARSVALRASVPREVVKALELVKGDQIDWVIEAVDNELRVSVEKVEN